MTEKKIKNTTSKNAPRKPCVQKKITFSQLLNEAKADVKLENGCLVISLGKDGKNGKNIKR